MIVDTSKNILIVGLGLLGGSYARVLKRFGFHIGAITKEQSSIDFALKEGFIDEGSTELDEAIIGKADLVIFALYPHVFVEWMKANQGLLKTGALITDVTGVKGSIVYEIHSRRQCHCADGAVIGFGRTEIRIAAVFFAEF